MALTERKHRSLEWTFRVDLRSEPEASRKSTRPLRVAERDSCRIIIPTDLMFAAWRQLFPAERMLAFGARQTNRGIRVTSLSDGTEPRPPFSHFLACPNPTAPTPTTFNR